MFGKIRSLFKSRKDKLGDVTIQNLTNSKALVVDKLTIASKDDLDSFYVDKKITKSEINKEDYQGFIGEIDLKDNLIDRKFYNLEDSNIKELGFFFNERLNDVDLLTAVEEKQKVVVLGNPGLGKTTELERVAYNIWYADESEYIPVYRNLKNFTLQDTINSYLLVKWKPLDKILFIFDGIDEIQNIQDFTSKLETFISNLDKNKVDYRFIVSCRTNVYESIVKSITEFHVYYLRDLSFQEGLKLLKQKTNDKVIDSDINDEYEGFLKNPFLVDIVSSYINSNNSLPKSTSELWEKYIDRRLILDEEEKLKKQTINPPLIKTYSRKLSLVNELMKTNVFNEDNLFKIVGNNRENFEEFRKNPLIEKHKGKPVWNFEHRNIQEYFAALAVSKKEFKNILEFIQISDTSRTHPSLFNTITFLINLLDKNSDKYNDLVNWFVNNEPELLFRADVGRISSDVKEKVFQNYFQKECIEKTLWINTNRTYELDKIAKFSDCKNNFQYLVKIYEDKGLHFRIRYSALEILAFFGIPNGELLNIRKSVLEEIRNNDNEAPIKAQLIRLINSKEELLNDNDLIEDVFEIFKTETNKEINTALLSLINDFEDIERFSAYIKEEFLRAHNLKKRDEEDEVGRGNSYKSQKLIIKLQSSEDFLEVMKYYFIDHTNLSYNNDFAEQLLERCIHFSKDDDDFVVNLLSQIKEHHRFHVHDRFLSRVIIDCNAKTSSLLYLLRNEKFRNVSVFVARFVDFTNVDQVVEIISEQEIDNKEIEGFRNMIGSHNHFERNIAVKFDELMRDKGVDFKQEVYTDEKRELDIKKHFENIQDQLDVLFNKKELLKRIEIVFKQGDDNVLTWDDISNIRKRWYEKNGHGNVLLNSPLDIIDTIMPRGNYKLKFEEVKRIVNNEDILFFELKKLIEKYKSSQWKYELLEEHKDVIKKWSIETSKKIDFANIIKLHKRGSFSFINDAYKKIELIFYFQDLIKFELDKEFLLNCIEFHQFDRTSEIDEGFENLKSQ
ncbi:MAG: NACHT domain-containing protein, partial [Psychroserpens sp.]|nr:NACHT domain-containing protein [Psychroserpens sp.]